MKRFLLIMLLSVLMINVNAQPFTLKSAGETKEFSLQIYFGTGGKGACVQYKGQKGIIPLKIKSYVTNLTVKPTFDTYVWDEIIDGKVNGSYGLTISGLQDVFDIWYERKKDGKRFRLEQVGGKGEEPNGNDKYLLHDVLLSFNSFNDDKLTISYPDGTKTTTILPSIDALVLSRQSIIADYNFDGYDDVAFSIPDAGMGVYRTFKIFLYNSKTKRFAALKEPDYAKSNCSCLCDVTINKQKKQLYTACRGGARWWQDAYHFNKEGKLVWVSSREMND
ncbi:XAC2610-related protein [Pedobacter punctiformis]|uniref:VCBS repeat-containing protein n=1 Tax=Pedobacter punctiformis TaxID=3004097 RepID=A0ABT4L987_9SPHI|nr:hypothetical protein [Pedobacter sp. HCMS5-2]MCZ4244262.1 hypothetical protein [Pedobacter sp. HCMS5-2]